jgi:hypothetical protein
MPSRLPLLWIEVDGIALEPNITGAIYDELQQGGLCRGVFYIGAGAEPGQSYLMWLRPDGLPVAASLFRDRLSEAESVRAAVREFIAGYDDAFLPHSWIVGGER